MSADMRAGKRRRSPRCGSPLEVEGPHPWAFLRQWRCCAGMTQEDVATHFGTTGPTVHRWETGRSGVDVGTMMELARLFRASGVDALLCAPPPQHGRGPQPKERLTKLWTRGQLLSPRSKTIYRDPQRRT